MHLDTSAFVPLNSQVRGEYGNATRGLVYRTGRLHHGPGDPARNLSLGPGLSLQLRGEVFNTFDEVNFNSPVTNISSTTFRAHHWSRSRPRRAVGCETDLVSVGQTLNRRSEY